MSGVTRRRTAFWQHRAKLVGLALLCLAFGSQALTLGRLQGAALVGQPLNLVVPVQIEAGETAASLCFEADVFHADTRQHASRVRVLVEAGAQPGAAQVRIVSSAPIDEPIVTVYLRAGCAQQTTRRYVLLAELPSAVAPSVPAVPLVVPVAPLSASPSVPESVAQAGAAVRPRTVRPKAASERRAAPSARASLGSPRSGAAAQAAPPAGRSRLTLDPLEFLSDRISNLESSAPIATPEDVLQSKQKIQVLEGSVTALQALVANNEASLADLKARLQKAESTRFPDPLVYGLIVLLLACLAALALLWQRQRHSKTSRDDWWHGAGSAPAAAPAQMQSQTDAPAAVPVKSQERAPAFVHSVPDSRPLSAVDVKLMDMSDSYFQDLLQSDPSASAKRQFSGESNQARASGPARELHTEALIDIRQQAEFFVSLGQPEQAVLILKRQIRESAQPNPLLYLDLLGILHTLGQQADFGRLRLDFSRCFTGRVPEFASFREEGRSLEAYPELLARITALWPTPQALALLEARIFKDSADATPELFDLAAFRELLLLYGLAQPAQGGAAAGGSRPAASAALDLPLPEIGSGHALDLDLSAAPSAAPTPPGTNAVKPGQV